MSNEPDPEAERERLLAELFSHAKPREQPPASDTEEVRRAVLAEWEAVTGRRRLHKRGAWAATAAAAAAVWFAYFGGGTDVSAPLALVARVEQVEGVVMTRDGARLAAGSGIPAGTEVASGDGRIGLRLTSGGSLRIAAGSRVVLASDDEAELLAGVLYFDSERERSSGFAVATELGRVLDVGTQFLVRLDAEELDVGVREGRITLTRGATSGGAGAGERLVTSQTAGELRRDAIATFGDEWAWVERVAPPFDIDGRTLGEFLDWFEAQTGRTVVFADAAAERSARAAVLSGSIELPPLEKLSAVLALTDLEHSLDGERVVIRAR
jgi:ferric-dicitrate binding protein FerR (iron transport regulator)